ncbi:hypothetical protein ANN_13633 [Periplaneta americana]|uniref:GIY-YIG domain-containing protein n=1 Tax=Periplaneta americana TaxID=6978 RepID=A0ABQ8TLE2_PERAM|nr:hypothetical protein ANN_13633 [Periplaneta americana]
MITPNDKLERKRFAETMLEMDDDDTFLTRVCFSDEATFHVSGKVNRHNCRIWGRKIQQPCNEHDGTRTEYRSLRISQMGKLSLRFLYLSKLWMLLRCSDKVMEHRKADGTLGHGVYRKPTHTDLYLNALSLHHPSQKKSVLTSLLHRAIVISDINNLPAEMDHLRRTLQQNNYSRRDINKALKQVTTRCNTIDLDSKQEPTKKAFIPFCGSVSHKISRILQKVNIKTIHKPQSKIRSHLRQVKDSQGLRTPGIYKIPCECGEVYIGQTGRTIEDRIKEHKRNLRLYYRKNLQWRNTA